MNLKLASRSPRRRELLTLLGVSFSLIDSAVDETPLEAEPAAPYTLRIARLKAAAGAALLRQPAPVLAADTSVSLGERLFGKPRDRHDAAEILRCLSGVTHEVTTAVVVIDSHGRQFDCLTTTRVSFRTLPDTEIAAYLATGEGDDKAGSYGIQGLGGALVSRIEGSYSAVVGLPLAETAALLRRVGVTTALD